MTVDLQYGRRGLKVMLPEGDITVIRPRFVTGLADERAAFHEAVRRPIGCAPLADLVGPADRVSVVVADITRALPTARLLPWLLAELGHVPAERFTIISGTGSHRLNTREELERLVGPDVAARCRVLSHDARDAASMACAGRSLDGRPVFLNRHYLDGDVRLVLGFIEPHFMAGFSGGYKGVFPAIADLDAIVHYHRAAVIGDPRSTWGLLDGNPTQAQIRHNGALAPAQFCVNVTLNRQGDITRFFCGDVVAAHEAGCAFARETAMVACERPFPVVVTTNGGYPLDQNLYQAVKGMSAAAQIVSGGGLIVAAAECEDGFPDHGHFRRLLRSHPSPEALLDAVHAFEVGVPDQWEAQLLALIRQKARVALKSQLDADQVAQAHLEPVVDVAARVGEELARLGRDAPVAVLPEGPMTIPYLVPDDDGRKRGSRWGRET